MVTRASAKKKGALFERQISDWLKEHWSSYIDRKVRTGAKDTGDIANFRVGGREVAVECKNVSQYALGTWVTEAEAESKNLGAVAGIVIAKRPRRADPGEQYVICTLDSFIKILAAAEGNPVKGNGVTIL